MKTKCGKIMIHKTKKQLPAGAKSRLSQKLLGYKDKSNYGKYTYKRGELLDSIPHISPLRAVVIVTRASLWPFYYSHDFAKNFRSILDFPEYRPVFRIIRSENNLIDPEMNSF